jgi:hypothetical protein
MRKNERITQLEHGLLDLNLRFEELRKQVIKLESTPLARADLEQRLKTLSEMEQRLRKLEVRCLGSSPERAEQAANPKIFEQGTFDDAIKHALRDTNSDEIDQVLSIINYPPSTCYTSGFAREFIQAFLAVRRGK